MSHDTRVPKITCSGLRQWSTHLAVLLGLALATMLTACGKTLDASKIQEAIKEDVIKKGATSLKSVFCPKDVPLEAGKTFECIGELEGGNAFAISVKQEDAAGKVQWDIPNAKGILNLEKLQTIFLASIKTAPGAPPEINCGGIYRAVKPGDSFDCVVTPKPTSADKKVAKANDVSAKDSELSKDSVTIKEQAKSTDAAAEADQSKTANPADGKDKSDQKATDQKEANQKEANQKETNQRESTPSDPAKNSATADKSAEKSKSADQSSQGNKSKVLPGQLVAIRISVDVDGNITWQQILEDPEVKVAATTPTSTVTATTSVGAAPNPTAAGGGTQPDATAAKPDAAATKPGAEGPAITTDAGED